MPKQPRTLHRYGPLGHQPVGNVVTQRALCRASGLSQGLVSRVIRGWHRSPRVVEAAVKLTGLPAEQLFTPGALAAPGSPLEAEDA